MAASGLIIPPGQEKPPGRTAPARPAKTRAQQVKRTLNQLAGDIRELDHRTMRKLAPVLNEARRELRADLTEWLKLAPGGNDRFTAQEYRRAILSVETSIRAIGQAGQGLKRNLTEASKEAGVLAVKHLEFEFSRFSHVFGGPRFGMVPTQIDTAAVVLAGQTQLIPRYANSAARYTRQVREDIKRQFGIGLARGETFGQLTNRLRRLGGPKGLVALRGQLGEPGALVEEISEGLFRRYHHWAERIVRTEMVKAYSSQHADALDRLNRVARDEDEELFGKRWDASIDGRLCMECAALDLLFIPADKSFPGGGPPLHPNCFPASTLVSGRFEAGLRANYSGRMVEIETAGGRVLRCTPNHRIATRGGFVPAAKLRKGNSVLCQPSDVWRTDASQVDKQQPPSAIEQVFAALGVTPVPVALASMDLHGDAAACNGKVDVVGTGGQLRNGIRPSIFERILDLFLPSPSMQHASLACQGTLGHFGETMAPAGHRLPRTAALTFDSSPIKLHGGPFEKLSLGPAAQVDTRLAEPAGQDAASDSRFVTDLFERFPADVAPDQIVNVRNFEFTGHVYDLQCGGGWMVAGGIYVGNCRCIAVAWHPSWGEMEGEERARTPGRPKAAIARRV